VDRNGLSEETSSPKPRDPETQEPRGTLLSPKPRDPEGPYIGWHVHGSTCNLAGLCHWAILHLVHPASVGFIVSVHAVVGSVLMLPVHRLYHTSTGPALSCLRHIDSQWQGRERRTEADIAS
jgi:hypothetical protein